MTPGKEAFAIFEVDHKRTTPLGDATLAEAKDIYRSLRNCFPNAPLYLVRLDVIDGASCQIQNLSSNSV